jgi:hypothetical protein
MAAVTESVGLNSRIRPNATVAGSPGLNRRVRHRGRFKRLARGPAVVGYGTRGASRRCLKFPKCATAAPVSVPVPSGGRPAPLRCARHARRELVHGVLASPEAAGAGRDARFWCMGFLSGLRVVFGDPRGGVRHARKQARILEPQMHTDAHGWDSDHRIGTAAQVRLQGSGCERACRTPAHPCAAALLTWQNFACCGDLQNSRGGRSGWRQSEQDSTQMHANGRR